MSGWAVVVLVGGAALELAGLALVALENVGIRRALRKRNVTVFPRPARASLTLGWATVTRSGEQTVDERITELAGRIDALGKGVAEAEARLRKEIEQEATGAAESVRRAMEFEVNEIRRLLGVTIEPTKRRWWGLGLFAAGLAAQTGSTFIR